MMKWFAVIATTVVLSTVIAFQAFASVTDDVKKTVDQVVSIVSNGDMKKPKNEARRRAALKAAIGGVFDYEEMARRSLGVHWKSRSSSEQREFVELFSTLLENSYAGKIESYENEKIVYDRESIDGKFAEVKSRIVTAKRDEYSLDYRLMRESGKWKVYDVVIEGVSLISNYRSQFNKIITSQGFAELTKKLKTKKDEIRSL
jgi:phospholipid transport system substrate-binding protein